MLGFFESAEPEIWKDPLALGTFETYGAKIALCWDESLEKKPFRPLKPLKPLDLRVPGALYPFNPWTLET